MIEARIVSEVWWNIVGRVRASTQKPLIMVLPIFQGNTSSKPNPAQVFLNDIASFVEKAGRKDHHVRTVYPSSWYGHLFDDPAFGALALSLYSQNYTELAIKKGKKVKEAMNTLVVDWALAQFERFVIDSVCDEPIHASDVVALGIFGRAHSKRKGTKRFADKITDYLIYSCDLVPHFGRGGLEAFPERDPFDKTHALEFQLFKRPLDDVGR